MDTEFSQIRNNKKTVILSGSSGGIGSSIAKVLADTQKYNLVLLYNKNKKKAYELEKSLSPICDTIVVKADITSSKEVKNALSLARQKFGKIDIIINNAGISVIKQIQDYTDIELHNILNTNLLSMEYIIRDGIKDMINNQFGKIVNISSMWGITGASCEVPYSASKAGVIGLTKALAKELGPSNINVNCICPGFIDTDMNKNIQIEARDEIKSSTPLNRLGTPDDISNLVLFLISDETSFITGQVITCDGGLTI